VTAEPADHDGVSTDSRSRAQLATFARESSAVLAAILIAFGLDAAWQGRVERGETRQALVALFEEFGTVREQLVFAIDYNREQVRIKDSLLRLDPNALAVVPEDQALVSLRSLRWAWTFDPSRGALDAVIAGGHVDQIRSPALRRLVSGWPGLYADLAENTIVQWGDALQRRRVELGLEAELRTVSAGSDPTGARDLLRTAVGDPLLRNLLAAHSERIEQYLDELGPALDSLEETIRLLSLELD